MKFFKLLLVALLSALLGACVTNPLNPFESKGAKTLAAGVTLYNDGQFPEALQSFQSALDMGLAAQEQVKAHKLMAFTYCATTQVAKCRDSFKKAFQVNPAFDLEASEAGHPAWGPVFRQVKQAR